MADLELVFDQTFDELRAAVVEKQVLKEIYFARKDLQSEIGNIYKGRVTRIMPMMKGAFVDIGNLHDGFLHFRDHPEHLKLHEGEEIIVMVSKDAHAHKGPRLSMGVSLAGYLLVYLPFEESISTSRALKNTPEEARLNTLVTHFQKELKGGWIIRSNAVNANENALRYEAEILVKGWNEMQQNAKMMKAPQILYREPLLPAKLLRDKADATTQVYLDSPPLLAELQTFVENSLPLLHGKLNFQLMNDPFSLYQLEEQLANAEATTLSLASGANIVIEETEAMTTIDINSASATHQRTQQDFALKVNLEASEAIVAQIRLRSISGQIAIDYLEMLNEAHQKILLGKLTDLLRLDNSPSYVTSLTHGNMVIVSRKRKEKSLSEIRLESCTACHGSGKVTRLESLVFDLFRAVKRLAGHRTEASSVSLKVSPEVADFLGSKKDDLGALEQMLAKKLTIIAEHRRREDYDIVIV